MTFEMMHLFLWSVKRLRLLLTFIFSCMLSYCYLLVSQSSGGNRALKTGSMPSPGQIFAVLILCFQAFILFVTPLFSLLHYASGCSNPSFFSLT